MPRKFVALTLFAALAALPSGGRAVEPNREKYASRDPHVAQLPSAPPAAAVDGEAGDGVAAEPGKKVEPIAAPDEPQLELIVERHANGQVKIKRYVTQDAHRNYVNHGPWTLFDANGNPVATGNYKMGKRHGAWSRVQPKSAKNVDGPAYKGFVQPFVWEASFTDDVLNGVWTMLDREGRSIRTWEFEQGRLHGISVDWHANGQKRREIRYEQGIPQGEMSEWDETGKLVAQTRYENGHPHRSMVEKYPSGEKKLEGWCIGPKEMVRVTFNWWEGAMHVDIAEVEGKQVRHGLWASWHPNGGKQYEGNYEHDKPVGVHTWWHANGQKQMSGHFVSGQETGRWTWWHENGRKSLEGEFVDGKKEGHWTAWHANGQKRETGYYAAGKKTGQWSSWNEAGQLIESRDRSMKPAPAETSPVSRPADAKAERTTDASSKPEAGPLSRREAKQVPGPLPRGRNRGDTLVR